MIFYINKIIFRFFIFRFFFLSFPFTARARQPDVGAVLIPSRVFVCYISVHVGGRLLGYNGNDGRNKGGVGTHQQTRARLRGVALVCQNSPATEKKREK